MRRVSLAVFALALLSSCASKAPVEKQLEFREVSEETGLVFQHFNGATGKFYLPEIMGAGAAVLDYDLDGDLDVYLIQGSGLDARAAGPEMPGNRLFRSELSPSGRLRFTDVTAESGTGHIGYGMGVAVGDYDNDGDPDLYVTNLGHNVLYRNNGNGTFTDVTRQAGVDDERWSTAAAFVDYDADGKLDLLVANYLNYSITANKPCFAPSGEPDYCNPSVYQGLPNRLFRNQGNGTFEDVSASSGIGSIVGKALGVVCFDHDRDGRVDIYVADDGVANHLWRNNGGVFEEIALPAGVAYSADGRAQAGMGVDAADFDNNGIDDIFVTNLIHETNNLYAGDGRGTYEDAIVRVGLGPSSRLYTGFGTRFFDYDNDGLLDLFVANGAVTKIEAQRGSPQPFRQPNQLFRNEGNGFREVRTFTPEEVGRGAAFGDIDNDGDLDIVVANNNGRTRLLLNESARPGTSLQVSLVGSRSNRQGLGARVTVFREDGRQITRRIQTDGSYLSASDSRVHFGLGGSKVIRVVVEWPSGRKQELMPLAGESFVVVREE